MPTKKKKEQEVSKKALQKKKNQIIEDKTFGLKNKNKSKKVQGFIKGVERSVTNQSTRQQQQEQQRKLALKERKKAQKAEQEALFGEALLAVSKRTSTAQSAGKIAAKGRDQDATTSKSNTTSRAMKLMYQMDAREVADALREQDPHYIPTVEDEIEVARLQLKERLAKEGRTGTPVTEASFAEWKRRKQEQRQKAAAAVVASELKKKKGGKGLSVLTGRDLYAYKKELFRTEEDDEKEGSDENGGGGKMVAAQVSSDGDADLFLEEGNEDLDDLLDDDE